MAGWVGVGFDDISLISSRNRLLLLHEKLSRFHLGGVHYLGDPGGIEFLGRGMEFLTLPTGGVQNSWYLWGEGYRIPDTSAQRNFSICFKVSFTVLPISPFSPHSNNWQNLFYCNSFSSWFREGYRIPNTSVGRDTEFLTPRMGGVQNSWPLDWRILYPPGPLNNKRPLSDYNDFLAS